MSVDAKMLKELLETANPRNDEDLRRLLPFEGLTQDAARQMLAQASVQKVPMATVCFEEGDDARNFYVLLDGVVRVTRSTSDGENVVMLHIAPGELFGIASAYDNTTYHATARPASDCVVLSWPSELWDEYVRSYPGFKSASSRAIGTRMEELQDKVVEMATLKVEKRIAQALLRLADQLGERTADGIKIGFPITRQDISEMTGTTLHSVSRCMSKWQKDGIISSTRQGILVQRPAELRA